jgi:ankyrin repeat protein
MVVRDHKMNLGNIEHATFDRAHLTPAVARVRSRFTPLPVKLVNTPCRISEGNLQMPAPKRRSLFQGGAVFLLLLWAMAIAPEPQPISISANALVRATTIGDTPLISLCLAKHVDPNGRDTQGRTPLLIAASQQDWKTVRRLIDAGALVDLADEKGVTPLMAAALHGNLEMFRALLARSVNLRAQARLKDGRDLLGIALDGGNPKIVQTVTERLPRMRQWTTSTQRALDAALLAGNKDQIRLLLGKNTKPPTPAGKNVPLLAYAVVRSDTPLFSTLLGCGADPNTLLPPRSDKDFLALLPSQSLRRYVEEDRNVTVLMLAAGLGRENCVRALLDARANRNRAMKRYGMVALDVAAETGQWRCTQILLGGGPSPEQLRLEISLASQTVDLIKDGVPIFRTECSTGRPGYSTRTGHFVITNKERNHRSTIYKVDMPYFMRLSCLDFGMHAGVVPDYPASHGCIRLPEEAARKFFAEVPIGTLVTVE